jgi:hypothetical protein
VPSELPVDINGFKSQQYRWAKGAAQTGRKLLGRVFRAPLPARIKFEALVHLTNNSSYVLMIILSLLIFPAMVLRRGSSTAMLLLVDLPLFLGATLSVVVFYLASQLVAGKGWRQIFYIPALLGLGIGLSVNNARAVVSGLLHEGGTFERTPKYSIVRRGQDWQGKRYKIGPNLSVLAEVILTLYFTGCTVYAYMAGMWMSIPFLFLFVHGYGYMATLSLKPAFLQWWARRGDPSLVRA